MINILNTIGHSDASGVDASTVKWQGMVGSEGETSLECSYPADADFLEYVKLKYAAFAKSGADRYWIDDDVRMGNHSPVSWGAFALGVWRTSETKPTRDTKGGRRLESYSKIVLYAFWTEPNSVVFRNLLKACAEGVRMGYPGAEIGLMSCDASLLVDVKVDFYTWFDESSKITGGAGWLRPGGGDDRNPRSILDKIYSVANTVSRLPSDVRSSYEVENYPYTMGAKKVQRLQVLSVL